LANMGPPTALRRILHDWPRSESSHKLQSRSPRLPAIPPPRGAL
jgi:hypothetical protein